MHIRTIKNKTFVLAEIEWSRFEREISELRYEVYCEEYGYVDEDKYENRGESDIYDSDSAVHFGIFYNGKMFGYMRLLLNRREIIPALKLHDGYREELTDYRLDEVAEISRFIIGRKRYKEMTGSSLGIAAGITLFGALVKEQYNYVRRNGIRAWVLLIEKSMHRMMDRIGVCTRCIGEKINHMGEVYPYITHIDDLDLHLFQNNRSYLEYLNDGLPLHQKSVLARLIA